MMHTADRRARFTLAHELGHHMLGHVGHYRLVNREWSANDNSIEQEANVFAARLLAPACVLHALQIASAEELARVCDVSLQAAEIRFARYQMLCRRGAFCSSTLERAVYTQFLPYIQKKLKGKTTQSTADHSLAFRG